MYANLLRTKYSRCVAKTSFHISDLRSSDVMFRAGTFKSRRKHIMPDQHWREVFCNILVMFCAQNVFSMSQTIFFLFSILLSGKAMLQTGTCYTRRGLVIPLSCNVKFSDINVSSMAHKIIPMCHKYYFFVFSSSRAVASRLELAQAVSCASISIPHSTDAKCTVIYGWLVAHKLFAQCLKYFILYF